MTEKKDRQRAPEDKLETEAEAEPGEVTFVPIPRERLREWGVVPLQVGPRPESLQNALDLAFEYLGAVGEMSTTSEARQLAREARGLVAQIAELERIPAEWIEDLGEEKRGQRKTRARWRPEEPYDRTSEIALTALAVSRLQKNPLLPSALYKFPGTLGEAVADRKRRARLLKQHRSRDALVVALNALAGYPLGKALEEKHVNKAVQTYRKRKA